MKGLKVEFPVADAAVKKARIMAREGKAMGQDDGLRIISRLLMEVEQAAGMEEAIAYAGIATGYANAMKRYGYITDGELQDVIEVIGQAGEKAANRIEAAKRPFLMRAIKKVVRI